MSFLGPLLRPTESSITPTRYRCADLLGFVALLDSMKLRACLTTKTWSSSTTIGCRQPNS